MISTSGFQSGAVRYAEVHGIALWQICNQYIKHITAFAYKSTVEAMDIQHMMKRYLPRYFVMEWDCSADYPYTQIYPTKEMYTSARNKAREDLIE